MTADLEIFNFSAVSAVESPIKHQSVSTSRCKGGSDFINRLSLSLETFPIILPSNENGLSFNDFLH